MSNRGLIRRRTALAVLGSNLLPAARAQAPWPSRPLQLVVAYAGGGAIDGMVRYAAEKIREHHPAMQFVIEYRPGASGNIAADAVAHMAGDGHQFLVSGSSTHAANASLLRHLPFDPAKDFMPVTTLAQVPYFLVVNPAQVPVTTLKDFIELARARPGQFSLGSSAVTGRLAGELLKQRDGIDLTFVSYKTLGQAVPDVVGGHLDAAFGDPLGYLPHVRSGRLRALAVSSAQRVGSAREVPTIAESGFADFDVTAWLAIWGRAGSLPESAERLSSLINSVLDTPEGRQFIASIGLVPMPGSPAQLAALQRRDTAALARLVRTAGITPE